MFWYGFIVCVGTALGGGIGSWLAASSVYIGAALGFLGSFWYCKEIDYELHCMKRAALLAWTGDVDNGFIHNVITYGYIEDVEYYLVRGANINNVFKDLGTPLHYAITNNSKGILEYLLKHNADIDFVVPKLGSPLHYACKMEKLDLVKLLIQNNAQINICDDQGYTPLYYAFANNKLSIIEILLENFADFKSMKDAEKLLPIVVQKGYYEAAEKLISLGAAGNTLLHIAVYNHLPNVFEMIADTKGVELNGINKAGDSVMTVALLNNELELAKFIKSKGCLFDAKKEGERIIINAAKNGHLDIFKYLVEDLHVNINAIDSQGNLAVYYAKGDLVKYICERGGNVNWENSAGETLLHTAVKNGDREKVKTLLDKGADPRKENNESVSILYDALFHGHVNIAEDLFNAVPMRKKEFMMSSGIYNSSDIINNAASKGWDDVLDFYIKHYGYDILNLGNSIFIALSNNKPYTAGKLKQMGARFVKKSPENIELFSKAVRSEWYHVVKKMLEFGISVDAPDANGRTPSYYAMNNKTIDVLKLLCNHGADLNKVDRATNSTLLYVAVLKRRADFVKFLCDRVDVNKLNGEKSETALVRSIKNGSLEIAKLLVARSSKEGLNIVDVETGKTPLQLALDSAQMQVIEQLLQHPHVELKRIDFTAISKSSPGLIIKVFETLLEAKKINPNEKCFADGQTFMHVAAKLGDLSLIEKLKSLGVSLETQDDNGLMPVRIGYESDASKECITALTPGMECKPPITEPSVPPLESEGLNPVVTPPSAPPLQEELHKPHDG